MNSYQELIRSVGQEKGLYVVICPFCGKEHKHSGPGTFLAVCLGGSIN